MASQRTTAPTIQYQAVEEISKNDEFVFVKVDKTLHKIMLDNIIYIQSDRNYVTLVTKDLSLSFIDSLKNWTNYLEQDNFLQVHKSFILNVRYIEKVTGNVVYVHEQKIPVGKTFKESLLSRVKPLN
jgi:two-component system response regulator LytT